MKIFRRVLLLCLLSVSLSAQQTVEQQAEDLRRAFSTPLVDWDQAFIQTTFQKYIDLYINKLLWDPDFQKKMTNNLPRVAPTVNVRVTNELRTPFAENSQIILPVSYIAYLYNISTLVGHDLYGKDNYVHLGRPLLSTPFRTNSIIPLLSPLYRFVDTNGYPAIQYYVQCPAADKKCAEVQQSSAEALILFALLHEISHQFFHHDLAYEGVDLDKELAADQNAFFVLTQLTSDFVDPLGDEDVTKEIKLAYRLSRIVWLEIEASRNGIANVVAEAREKILVGKLTNAEHEEIDDLLQPEITSDNLARLAISWNEDPDLLIVDGVAISASDMKGKTLIVTAGSHTVVATRPDAISVNEFSSHSIRNLSLVFKPFVTLDRVALTELEKQKDWLGILCGTSDEELRPRNAMVGLYHWEAIHHLGLDGLIAIDDWSSIPEFKRRAYLGWQNSGTPLLSWYAGLAPGNPQ
jgi:hypothetical protein